MDKDLVIQKLKEENARLKDQLEQKWIPVEDDRKPKKRQKILISCKGIGENTGIEYVMGSIYMNAFDYSVEDVVITAWQPAPNPYRPNEEGGK